MTPLVRTSNAATSTSLSSSSVTSSARTTTCSMGSSTTLDVDLPQDDTCHHNPLSADDEGPKDMTAVQASDEGLASDGILVVGAVHGARAKANEAPAPAPQEGAAEVPDEDERLEPLLENISILAHLALFAMLGVVVRFGLEIFFGPSMLHVTDDSQALFLDIPPNMLGSFIMGIVGYVGKRRISEYSQPLAIGLSTGLCGSITTFASWNQRMMAILAYGLVARSLFGYLLGTALTYYSFLVGVDAAQGVAALVKRHNQKQGQSNTQSKGINLKPENYQRRWVSLLVSVFLTMLILIVAAVIFALDSSSPKLKKAAVGCLCGPFGCWLRWFLSWQNGNGVPIGGAAKWKWVPVGTLAANILAVTLEGATSAIDAVHNSMLGSIIVGGLQLGFMGCLSTVSSLIQEVHILKQAKTATWRAYVYLYVLTILPSICLGILTYCVPVWVLGAAANGYNKADLADQANLFSEFK